MNDTIKTDLELLEATDPKNKSMYEILFNPDTIIGNEHLKKWSNYYTTDIKYLKETQNIFKNIEKMDFEPNIVNDTYKSWHDIKNDDYFISRYQYIGWDKIKWLNYSLVFLHVLSIYNLSSPVINLMSPLALFFVPFIMLKGLRVPITWPMYKKILKAQLKNHALGQLFTSFHKVKPGQKLYILFCSGMYFYNIYQNILSCKQFYNNSYFIANKFEELRQYLTYTIDKMKTFEEIIKPYDSYSDFYKELCTNRLELENFLNVILNIPKKCMNFKNLFKIGKIMKYFYKIYDCENLNKIMQYSFGFNGYMDNLKGLEKIKKQLNNAKFINSEKKNTLLKMKKVYHPSITEILKNNIDLKKIEL